MINTLKKYIVGTKTGKRQETAQDIAKNGLFRARYDDGRNALRDGTEK